MNVGACACTHLFVYTEACAIIIAKFERWLPGSPLELAPVYIQVYYI